MNEWEAKYKALLMGIDNETYIEIAEKFVCAAMNLSATSGQPFEEVFYAMHSIVKDQQWQDTLPLVNVCLPSHGSRLRLAVFKLYDRLHNAICARYKNLATKGDRNG